MASNEGECPRLHHKKNQCAEYKRIEQIQDNQLEYFTLVFCLKIEKNNECDNFISMAWEVINPKCPRKMVHIKKIVKVDGNYQVSINLVSKRQQVFAEKATLQVTNTTQMVRMTIESSTWENNFNIWKNVNFIRVRFLTDKKYSLKNGGGGQSNKFRESAAMKSFLWRSEEKFKTELSSGRYENSVCSNVERETAKTNHGEKEATSSDTLFLKAKIYSGTDTLFLKAKICSGTNKDKVSNQQVLKTPAREGDKLDLTNEEVGRGYYYKGIIDRVNLNGTFDAKNNDGDFYTQLKSEVIKLLSAAPRKDIDSSSAIHSNGKDWSTSFEEVIFKLDSKQQNSEDDKVLKDLSNIESFAYMTEKRIRVKLKTLDDVLTYCLKELHDKESKESSGKLCKDLNNVDAKRSGSSYRASLDSGYGTGLAGIFRKHIWKVLNDELSKEISDNISKDISDELINEMNYLVYCY